MRRQASCTVVTFRRYGVDNAPRDHKFPSEKGAGKYVQRGKWFYLKYLLFICILHIRKVNLHVVWMISPLINIVSLSFQVVGR